jgi:hypothetical protein
MGGISNTLRQRLAARPAPQVHPEADMLTAYVEQALPAAERDQIVRHLADCADCREVAALSLPMQPELQQARTLPSGGRKWLLGLRWAGLAATVVIVAALAIKQPWRTGSNQFVGSNAPSGSSQPQPVPPTTPASALPDQPVASTTNPVSSGALMVASASAPAPKREASAMDAKTSYVNVDRFAAGNRDQEKDADDIGASSFDARALPSVPPPQPGAGNSLQSVFATGRLSQGGSQPDLLVGLDRSRDPGAGLQRGSSTTAGKSNFVARLHLFKAAKKVVRPVITGGGLTGSTMGGDGAFSLSAGRSDSTASAGLARPTAPEKDKVASSSVEAAGGPSSLKESSAAFTEKARAPAATTTTAGAYSYEVSAVQWKVAEGKLLKSAASFDWQEAYPLHNIAFTTVTHQGNDVWAGGAHAALVHSRNGGAAWEKVNIGDAATGDIAKITIEGAKITVKTSTQQTWSSQDGGRSWTLAPSN